MKIKTTRGFTMLGAGPLGPVSAEIKPGEILDVDEMQAQSLMARGMATEHNAPKTAKSKAAETEGESSDTPPHSEKSSEEPAKARKSK